MVRFAESQEVIGGDTVFEASDLASATALAQEFVQMHIYNGLPNMTLSCGKLLAEPITSFKIG